MSGFKENHWNRFLNGGTSNYNFSYRSEPPPNVIPLQPQPQPQPILPSKKINEKVVIPTIKGGKRKSRRAMKKSRRTHKK